MGFEFRPQKAVRTGIRLLIGISGPTGSGKTYSAMLIAKGLSGGKRFCVIDTENGRASMYAEDFDFDVVDFQPPFSSERYEAVIRQMDDRGYPVVIIDSGSHEHDGEGGYLEFQESENVRLARGEEGRMDSVKFLAYAKAAEPRKKFKSTLIRRKAHVIMCLRADQKTEIIDDPAKPGKKKIVPKTTMAGFYDWIPIVGRPFPYEFTTSILVLPDKPGVPKIIKPNKRIDPMIPTDKPITEQVGVRLADWAAGGDSKAKGETPAVPPAKDEPPAVPSPHPSDKPKHDADQQEAIGKVEEIKETAGKRLGAKINGTMYGTFSDTCKAELRKAKEDGSTVRILYRDNTKDDRTYHNIEEVQVI